MVVVVVVVVVVVGGGVKRIKRKQREGKEKKQDRRKAVFRAELLDEIYDLRLERERASSALLEPFDHFADIVPRST